MACDEKALSPDDQTPQIHIWLHGERENRLKTSKIFFLLNFHNNRCALTRRTCTIVKVLHVFICFPATLAPQCIFVSYKRVFGTLKDARVNQQCSLRAVTSSQHAQKRLKRNNNPQDFKLLSGDKKKFECKLITMFAFSKVLTSLYCHRHTFLIRDC